MIRTYARKPQEYRYIEGVMRLCRLCLGTAETAVPIFTDDPANICSSLALRIMICVGLDVKRDDNLPNLVCGNCYKELEHYYAFRKRCEVSYQKLKSHLQASRNRQTIDAITEENAEILKEIGINQDENMNINDFGLIMEGEGAGVDSKVVQETVPLISDVHTVNLEVQQVHHQIEHVSNVPVSPPECHPKQPFDLSTLMTSVLVKLGVLARQRGRLAVLRPDVARVQLETSAGLVRMQLVEEEDEEEIETQTSKLEPFVGEPESITRLPVEIPKTTFIESKRKLTKMADAEAGAGAGAACGACGRVLASRAALRRHARVHSGERPFACPRCARAFAQKEVMLRHALVHDEVRPHKCSSCDKSFTQRNALVLHERSHLPPHERALALHSCPHCPKLFLYSSGLSRHMMTHSGRVYVCGTCRRQFADKSSVLRHHRARHAHLAEPELAEPEPEPAGTEQA